MICVFFGSKHSIAIGTKEMTHGQVKKIGMICLFALMTFTKCFVFDFRAKLQPLKPAVGGWVGWWDSCWR